MFDVLLDILEAALLGGLLRVLHIGEELLLVNLHVHLSNEDAVSGDAVALAKNDDVAYDEVLAVDGLSGAHVSTEHIDFIVLDFLLKEQELLLLAPVAEGLDQTGEKDGECDGRGVYP